MKLVPSLWELVENVFELDNQPLKSKVPAVLLREIPIHVVGLEVLGPRTGRQTSEIRIHVVGLEVLGPQTGRQTSGTMNSKTTLKTTSSANSFDCFETSFR